MIGKIQCCILWRNKKIYILFLPFELVILKTGNTSYTHSQCIKMSKKVFLEPKEVKGTSVKLLFFLTMKSWSLTKERGELRQDAAKGHMVWKEIHESGCVTSVPSGSPNPQLRK